MMYTIEEQEWLVKNYPVDESREETYSKFVQVFGEVHTFASFLTWCKKAKLRKPAHRRYYQKGNRVWSTGLSKEEHRKHFSAKSYANMCACVDNFENSKNRKLYNVPEGYVLSDLGNGEKIMIEKKIYKCMTYLGALHKGELTKAVYETYLAKREVEKIKGKKIASNPNANAEFLSKIRPIANSLRRKCIIATKDGLSITFTSMSEASEKLGIPISLISRTLNGQRSHTHGWSFVLN